MTGLVRSELSEDPLHPPVVGAARSASSIYAALQAGITAGFAGVDPGAGQPGLPPLDSDEAIRSIYATGAFTGAYVFALILGVTGMTAEYRYQTATPTFLATPRRARVVVAKAVAHLGVGVGLRRSLRCWPPWWRAGP